MTQELEQSTEEIVRALAAAEKSLKELRRKVGLTTLGNSSNWKDRHDELKRACKTFNTKSAELCRSVAIYAEEYDWNWQIEGDDA